MSSTDNAIIPNKLAFTKLHCSISSYTLKGLRSNKPSHKHDSNKYQSKAFAICDHKSDQTRSVTNVNKTYLVWLMYLLLFTQYYQHRTNQKLKLFLFKRFISYPGCQRLFMRRFRFRLSLKKWPARKVFSKVPSREKKPLVPGVFISKLKNWPLYPNFIPFTPLLPHLFIYSVSSSKIRVVYI